MGFVTSMVGVFMWVYVVSHWSSDFDIFLGLIMVVMEWMLQKHWLGCIFWWSQEHRHSQNLHDMGQALPDSSQNTIDLSQDLHDPMSMSTWAEIKRLIARGQEVFDLWSKTFWL